MSVSTADVLAEIHDPVAFAHKCICRHGLAGRRDEDELVGVALAALVAAAATWRPDGGRKFVGWAWLNMRWRLYDEVGRRRRHLTELGDTGCWSDSWRGEVADHDAGLEQVETRADLQRWADLAELTASQRHKVEWFALHAGSRARIAADRSPITGGGGNGLRRGLAYMRRAATTGRQRDDNWTRRQRTG
jgi:hypothetical protein